MPGVPININGVDVEHWLAPITTIVYLDEVEITGEGLVTVARPASNTNVVIRDEDGTVLQAYDYLNKNPVTLRTNLYGQTPVVYVPRLDYTYDAGYGPQDVHSSDADEVYRLAEDFRDIVLAAQAQATEAAAAAQKAVTDVQAYIAGGGGGGDGASSTELQQVIDAQTELAVKMEAVQADVVTLEARPQVQGWHKTASGEWVSLPVVVLAYDTYPNVGLDFQTSVSPFFQYVDQSPEVAQ